MNDQSRGWAETWAANQQTIFKAFDPALQHMLEGPRYATLFDLDRKLLELQRATLARDKEVAAYQAIVQAAWSTAFERFRKGLAESRQLCRGKGIADWLRKRDRA